MKVELRNIKTASFVVDEPGYYQATIYLDGVKAIEASNGGTGGGDNFRDLIPGSVARLKAHCATLPAVKYHGTELPMTPDLLIGELMENAEVKKKITRQMKKQCLYTRTDAVGLWSVKTPYSASTAAQLRKTIKVDQFLNALPIDEAAALYLKLVQAAEEAQTASA